MADLTGLTMVVTGGSSGIGLALAERAIDEGMAVAICGRQARLDDAADQLRARGGNVFARIADVTDEQSMDDFRDAVFEWAGAVNLLCCNAGVTQFRPLAVTSLAEFNAVVDINLGGTFNTLRAFVPKMMQTPGFRHVLFTGSMSSLYSPVAGLVAYSASKMGCLSLSESLANEYPRAVLGQTFAFIDTTDTDIMRNAVGEVVLPDTPNVQGADGIRHSPADVAAVMLDAVKEGRRYVVNDTARRADVEQIHREWVDAFRAEARD